VDTLPPSWVPLLGDLAVPALVIYGSDDLFFPIEHGRQLAELLPEARLLALDGVEHVFPYPDMARVAGEIVSHLGG